MYAILYIEWIFFSSILYIQCTKFSTIVHNLVHLLYATLQRMYKILYFQTIEYFKKGTYFFVFNIYNFSMNEINYVYLMYTNFQLCTFKAHNYVHSTCSIF